MSQVFFVIVPDYAEKALIRNMFSLSKFMDFPTIRRVLSINDIVTIVSLQRYWVDILRFDQYSDQKRQAFSTVYDLKIEWKKSCKTEEDSAFLDQVFHVSESLGQEDEGVSSRYFNKNDLTTVNKKDEEIREIAPYVYGVVITPECGLDECLNKKLLRAMMEKMSVYLDFEEIAHTRWFDAYLKALST